MSHLAVSRPAILDPPWEGARPTHAGACRARPRTARRLHRYDLRASAGVAGTVRARVRRAGGSARSVCGRSGRAAGAVRPSRTPSERADRARAWHIAERRRLHPGRLFGRSGGLVRLSRAGRSGRQHAAPACLGRRIASLWRGGARPARHLQFRRRRRQGRTPAGGRSAADRHGLAHDALGRGRAGHRGGAADPHGSCRWSRRLAMAEPGGPPGPPLPLPARVASACCSRSACWTVRRAWASCCSCPSFSGPRAHR